MHQPSLFDPEEPTTPPAGKLPTHGAGIDFAGLWAQMSESEIPHLLHQSDTPEGRRKIADMISRNRPEFSAQVELTLIAMTQR